jgi:hypothetical protein
VTGRAAEYLPGPAERGNSEPKPDAPQDTAPLRPGEFDPLAGEGVDTSRPERDGEPASKPNSQSSASVLRVFNLTEILSYEPPVGSLLVGDGVIELGEIALLYGPPGSFKGFAVGHLMACLAKGNGCWLGHLVNARCASLWVNCENGQRRLRDQFRKMSLPLDAEKFIHVTDIPAVWNLADVRLAGAIRQTIVEKQIRLLIIDTVSNFTSDEFAKEFAAFFAALNTMLHGLEIKPAVLLIHHSRKPKESDKGARGLLNLISGHQTLQRRARSICYLGRVSDDFDEQRMAAVWLKVANNGEAEGTKTALQLADDATLQEIKDFDWSQWEGASSSGARHEPKVNEGHIRELFEDGRRKLALKQAAEQLQDIAEVGRSAAYEALKLTGRFAALLARDPDTGLMGLRPAEPEPSPETE